MATTNLGYHFYIVYHSVPTEVFPLNFLETSLVDEKERDQIFYRRKFNGTLTFGGRRLKDDYDLLHGIYLADPCGRIDFLIYQDTTIYYESYFSASQGAWDFDQFTFTVTPIPYDNYNDILDVADIQYNILDVTPKDITTNIYGSTTTYTRNRWLMDVVRYLANKVSPGSTVSSTFFTAATNPVTLDYNFLTLLTIAQKSDIKDPTSSNPATTAMMSWNQLMNILWGMFQVAWSYDAGIITVEHISFFSHSAGVDIRTQLIGQSSNKFRYLTEKMPKYEKFAFMEADEVNFVGVPIWYDSVCVDQDPNTNVKETSVNVTTDLQFIQNNPTAITNEGFVILCNYVSGGNYYVRSDKGAYFATSSLNMDLSWANLHNCYFRHNRVLITGYMNDILTTFWTAQKTKIQPINAIICPEADYNPEDYITTELGEVHFEGEKAYVQKAVIKPYREVNFTLLYGPEDNENTGVVNNKIITITEVVSEAGPGLSHYYAVCNQPANVQLTITIHLICQDEDDETCETDTESIVIPIGSINGTCVVTWCQPVAKDAVCIAANHHDTTGAPGWTVIWHYDNAYYC